MQWRWKEVDRFEIYIEDKIDRACCYIKCLVIRKKEDSVNKKNKQLKKNVESRKCVVFKPRENNILVRKGQLSVSKWLFHILQETEWEHSRFWLEECPLRWDMDENVHIFSVSINWQNNPMKLRMLGFRLRVIVGNGLISIQERDFYNFECIKMTAWICNK